VSTSTSAAVIPQLPATVSPADLALAVAEYGVAIVTDFVDVATRAQIGQDLRRWIAATPAGSRSGDPEWEDFHGARTVRLNGLAAKSPTFLHLAIHPTVLGWAERSLVPGGGAIQVNDTQAIVIGPGQRAQYLHRDQSAWPWFNQLLPDGPEVTVVAMVAMTEFTAGNGATRVVPFSHLRADSPELFDPAASVPAEMPAGSMLVFSGRTIHGGGANVTAHEHRVALHISYALGWLRSEEAHPFAIPLEVAASMPATARTLFGFGQYDPAPADGGRLWLVDFEDPARFLFEGESA
jgi:ectoine hydroxylase-related dioxygenase (phytanoyl-CoA dioxygenase family)